jgi:5-methylcytosine-specific restriction endonuclease McrA
MAKFNRQTYERRSEERREAVKEDKYKRIQEAQQFIWDYLSTHPCRNCGESDPVVLEFNHVRGRKKYNISDMPRRGYSIAAIQSELAKCEVLCANCHRRRTSRERGWFTG